ncbi:PKD-like family lipoprotein, partial [Sphingobacterium sp. SGL-16]|uniref:PKD-like family lipoprotein n=1 Tax=Sphingobacterium sp. SGL-16 TaxID=2710883 RepID=UPI0013EACEA5
SRHIVESKPSNSTFEYEWKALSNEKATLLSTDRDLRISVGLAPGSYNLQYTVTDKSNGLQFNKLYNLKVNSGFNSGWFVTHNKNNKAGLSFIRTDKTVFSAPAEDANNKSFSGKALRTYYAFLNNQQNYASILYFTTEGVYRFDPNNFAQVGDTQTILPTVSSFTSIPNNNASLIYEFPSSAKVTSLVMDKSTGNVGKTLAVGVMNNGEGEVYFFNINTLGWFTNNTFDSSFKGLGEVIHLSKKF